MDGKQTLGDGRTKSVTEGPAGPAPTAGERHEDRHIDPGASQSRGLGLPRRAFAACQQPVAITRSNQMMTTCAGHTLIHTHLGTAHMVSRVKSADQSDIATLLSSGQCPHFHPPIRPPASRRCLARPCPFSGLAATSTDPKPKTQRPASHRNSPSACKPDRGADLPTVQTSAAISPPITERDGEQGSGSGEW